MKTGSTEESLTLSTSNPQKVESVSRNKCTAKDKGKTLDFSEAMLDSKTFPLGKGNKGGQKDIYHWHTQPQKLKNWNTFELDTWNNLICTKKRKPLRLYNLTAKLREQSKNQKAMETKPTVSAASDAVGGDGMLPVLSDCPHRELMLSNGHWSCLLKDRDCLSWNTLCHLTGDCLNNTAGCRYCGKCNCWLFIHACLRVEQTTIIYYPGLGASFILINILAVIHTPGLQRWNTAAPQKVRDEYLKTLKCSLLCIYSLNIKNIFLIA